MPEVQDNLTRYDPSKFRKKFKILLWVVLIALSVLIARMWSLQVIKGDVLRQRSENNRVRLREIKPLRGLIKDIKGNVLVDNQASFDISIVPEDAGYVNAIVKNLELLYANKGLKLSGSNISPEKRIQPFVPIKLERNISREKLAIAKTNSPDLPGIVVDVMPVREYILGEMMAHILGYMGEISSSELRRDTSNTYKPGDMVGKYGIEKYLDKYLKGESGGEQIEVNVAGRQLKVLGKINPVPGYNVVLTIDSHLQSIARDALEGKAGSVVVMDPRDGSVLVMLSSPSFDPNLFNRGISIDNWEKLLNNPLHPMENRAISGQYPPGSTYKLIVAAAALEEGLITPEASFFCDGSFTLGNRTSRCWKKGGHGKISLHRAIVESCDVYFYNLGKLVGITKLAEYSRGFGLGTKTGINLPGEKSGLVPTREWKLNRFKEPWQMGETISIAIGQGFTLVTPIQLLNTYCALANEGTFYVPRIIKRIETAEGQIIKEFNPEIKSHIPVSKKNIEILKQALWGAVNENQGTGRALKRKEEDVCGKTGTAQVVSMPEDGEDVAKEETSYKLRDHALFVCFAPSENPEIAVAVVVEHGGHGGSAAAPIARKIIDGYFENRSQ
ncbi:MAG: penicillin-binding protein 2 [Thermodesulfobacteriota bacterium]|nr:penicillin-binding protein 2 [Thermodesulfobacteriota bacterium]